VIALLGDPRAASDGVYDIPFYPAPRGAIAYRFDTGSYGGQVDVLFGPFGLWNRVTEVRRHGIE
jgi:hypothetical protein